MSKNRKSRKHNEPVEDAEFTTIDSETENQSTGINETVDENDDVEVVELVFDGEKASSDTNSSTGSRKYRHSRHSSHSRSSNGTHCQEEFARYINEQQPSASHQPGFSILPRVMALVLAGILAFLAFGAAILTVGSLVMTALTLFKESHFKTLLVKYGAFAFVFASMSVICLLGVISPMWGLQTALLFFAFIPRAGAGIFRFVEPFVKQKNG
jgi:hypothetical protein